MDENDRLSENHNPPANYARRNVSLCVREKIPLSITKHFLDYEKNDTHAFISAHENETQKMANLSSCDTLGA